MKLSSKGKPKAIEEPKVGYCILDEFFLTVPSA